MGLPIISDIIGKVLDKVVPDAAQRDQMKLQLAQLDRNGSIEDEKIQMSAILAEAQSQDKWTSRARPSFLYVMYIMILMSIPFSLLFAFSPATALQVTDGLGRWLRAIPDSLYAMMTAGYLGYGIQRSVDKYNESKGGK